MSFNLVSGFAMFALATTAGLNNGHAIQVGYAPGESFAVPLSMGKTLWLQFDPTTREFGEWVRDWEEWDRS